VRRTHRISLVFNLIKYILEKKTIQYSLALFLVHKQYLTRLRIYLTVQYSIVA
jgi:hypothetical protein